MRSPVPVYYRELISLSRYRKVVLHEEVLNKIETSVTSGISALTRIPTPDI